MNKITILFFLLNFGSMLCFADIENKIETANQMYDQEMYSQAIDLYEDILSSNIVAAELYYNLGNAYFKDKNIAKAILNYERALHIRPYYADAEYNLKFARNRTMDDIKVSKNFFLKEWYLRIMKSEKPNTWLYISVSCFILCLCFILAFIFSTNVGTRKINFTIAVISILISIFTLSFSIYRKWQLIYSKEAIVMQNVVIVKSSPGQGSTKLFELHEGAKVKIKSLLGDWVEISFGDQREGWIEIHQIEEI